MTSNSPSGFRKLDGVSSEIAKVLARKGITVPTPVQVEVIPAAQRGMDVLAQAPTGSGKTLAFGIPIISRMPDRVSAPLALILVPTRELAVQVADELRHCATTRGFKVAAVFGGANIMAQTVQSKRAAIIVATPGRFDDMMRKSLIKVSRIRTVVLDEADRMLDMGFQPQVDRILERLPAERQTLLFSATLSGAMRSTIDGYVNDPFVVQVPGFEPMDMGGIDHHFTTTTNPQRMDTLIELLNSTRRDLAAVFVRTKRGADRLDKKLRSAGVKSTAIHGGMTQSSRLRELKRFSNGHVDTIIATDVFARGMDVDRITHVVNFDPPEDADTYKHRVGRTGRAGRTGVAISLVSPDQRKFYQGVARSVGIDATVIGGRPGRRAEERNAAEQRTGGSNLSSGNSKPRKTQPPRPERHETPSRVERFESASTDPRNIKPVNLERNAGSSRKERQPERGQRSEHGSEHTHGKPFVNDRSVKQWSGKPGTSRPNAGASTVGYTAKAGSNEGVVKWFADRKGFGFIERLEGDDLFVHQSSIEMRGRRTLAEGQMVTFETGPGKRGEEARNVKILAGSAPHR